MSGCNDILLGSNPSCAAIKKPGGVKKRIWIGLKSEISGYTRNGGTDDIETISMAMNGSIPYTLKKFISKRDKINVQFPAVIGENVVTYNHQVSTPVFYSTTQELNNLEVLMSSEEVFVIVEGNDEKLMVLGIKEGMKASAGEGGLGVLVNDNTAYNITLAGEQTELPKYFNISTSATLAQNIAYLDAISE